MNRPGLYERIEPEIQKIELGRDSFPLSFSGLALRIQSELSAYVRVST